MGLCGYRLVSCVSVRHLADCPTSVAGAVGIEIGDDRNLQLSAAISARRNPTCKPTERIARSRKPAIISSAGRSSSLRACAFEKASVEPSPRLSAGRSISVTGFFAAWPVPHQVLVDDDSAAQSRC